MSKHLAEHPETAGFTWTAPDRVAGPPAASNTAHLIVPWSQVRRRSPDRKRLGALAMHHMANDLLCWDDGVRWALRHHEQTPKAPDGCRLHANPE